MADGEKATAGDFRATDRAKWITNLTSRPLSKFQGRDSNSRKGRDANASPSQRRADLNASPFNGIIIIINNNNTLTLLAAFYFRFIHLLASSTFPPFGKTSKVLIFHYASSTVSGTRNPSRPEPETCHP
jgi:hypothetical protein